MILVAAQIWKIDCNNASDYCQSQSGILTLSSYSNGDDWTYGDINVWYKEYIPEVGSNVFMVGSNHNVVLAPINYGNITIGTEVNLQPKDGNITTHWCIFEIFCPDKHC